MFEWFSKLPDTAKASIVAAFVGAGIAAIIALMTIGLKDYILPLLTETRAAKKLRKYTFGKYGNPLIVSSVSLLYRLKEILDNRGYFLHPNAAKNPFNEYKRISTLYRLCALLGWLRASALELSYVQVGNNKHFQRIQNAMQEVERSLADGHHVEKSRIEEVAKLLGFNLAKKQIGDLGYRTEIIMHRYCEAGNVSLANRLAAEQQYQLVKEIADFLSEYMNKPFVEDGLLRSKIDLCIREMSRIETYLYRDWQYAIGDFMIRATNNESRKYEVVGYKEFEEMYNSTEEDTQKWIKRVRRLFDDLDTTIKERFDNRTEQLYGLYAATYKLLQAVSTIKTSNINIAKKAFEDLSIIMKSKYPVNNL